jgi:hypothetical protein
MALNPSSLEKKDINKMSVITTITMSLPEKLVEVLSIRSKPGLLCPEEIRSRIAQIRSRVESFRGPAAVRYTNSPAGRRSDFVKNDSFAGRRNAFGSVNRNETWGRPEDKVAQPDRQAVSRPKFTVSEVKPKAPDVKPHNEVKEPQVLMQSPPQLQVAAKNHFEALVSDEPETFQPVATSGYSKFKSKFKKDASNANELDDRILGHIRAKINKFSAQNYKKVLNFLRQNMDSSEKIFLEQFMALIFSKAAEEDTFVALYAQLLADLTPEFPYLKDEMQKLFGEYLHVFMDAEGKEDTTSENYGNFLDASKRKQHRRGYSLFIAQIATKGLITEKELLHTTLAVAESLIANATKVDQKLLVEELADCLTNIMGVAKKLNAFDEMKAMFLKLKDLMSKDAVHLPGLTNKARFALMDCLGI